MPQSDPYAESVKLVFGLLARPIAFHRPFATLTGSVEAALFLSQALYWQRVAGDREFYKTAEEWEDETALGRHPQERARHILKSLKILKECRKGVPAKIFYRVDLEALYLLLSKQSQSTQQSADFGNLDCQTPTNKSANSGNLYKEAETTTESTTKNPAFVSVKGKTEAFSPPPWVPLDAWDAFLESRAAMKKKPTPRALELLVAKLERLRAEGNDPKRVLEQSVENGWQGIFQIHSNGNGGDKKKAVEYRYLDGTLIGVGRQ